MRVVIHLSRLHVHSHVPEKCAHIDWPVPQEGFLLANSGNYAGLPVPNYPYIFYSDDRSSNGVKFGHSI